MADPQGWPAVAMMRLYNEVMERFPPPWAGPRSVVDRGQECSGRAQVGARHHPPAKAEMILQFPRCADLAVLQRMEALPERDPSRRTTSAGALPRSSASNLSRTMAGGRREERLQEALG